MFVGLLYLFDVPTFLSSLTNFYPDVCFALPKASRPQVAMLEGEVWLFPHGISYLMLSVEGSLGLRYLGIGRVVSGPATLGREHGTFVP